jgi:hypothetical protein
MSAATRSVPAAAAGFERTGAVAAVGPLVVRSGGDSVAIELYADTRITRFLRANVNPTDSQS